MEGYYPYLISVCSQLPGDYLFRYKTWIGYTSSHLQDPYWGHLVGAEFWTRFDCTELDERTAWYE